MRVETFFCVQPQLLDLGPNMARAGKREQDDDGNNVGDVPENRGKRSLEGTLLEYHGEKSEDDINGRKDTDDCKDDVRDFVVDIEKKFDEAGKEKEDCSVQ
jgi:hypothetical protein